MDNKDIISNIEKIESLNKFGVMNIEINKFINDTIYEDRVVGFSGTGKNMSVFSIGKEKLEKSGCNYKTLLDNFPDVTWLKQNLGDEIALTSEDHYMLIENYESALTRKNMIKDKSKRECVRSYKK